CALLFFSSPLFAAEFTVGSTADMIDQIPGDGVCKTAAGIAGGSGVGVFCPLFLMAGQTILRPV
ncbi:MAG: hypothetical protein Q7S00_00620, partial [bacterium]|nr:hypothetical protein [bacterium]